MLPVLSCYWNGFFAAGAAQNDSDWEIRVAIYAPQHRPAGAAYLPRPRSQEILQADSPLLRFIISSCYLLADWVADLGLGLLLNNLGNIGRRQQQRRRIELQRYGSFPRAPLSFRGSQARARLGPSAFDKINRIKTKSMSTKNNTHESFVGRSGNNQTRTFSLELLYHAKNT
ncbi:hypothetical protein GUJ93_ZPchr0007g3439 [Zizania palustris]|uniref:Uncharacterized protein n=1 Tax=Zizania palustris TaxID=103762 RepID=A0A8J5STH0_ZIZPA|nr:hypothetical protein GUJ93_ZPchr0007g3439 [Zizania palustris]